MSVRDEWRDWPGESSSSLGLPDEDVLEGIWWAAMAFSIGLLIYRLLQIAGVELG